MIWPTIDNTQLNLFNEPDCLINEMYCICEIVSINFIHDIVHLSDGTVKLIRGSVTVFILDVVY